MDKQTEEVLNAQEVNNPYKRLEDYTFKRFTNSELASFKKLKSNEARRLFLQKFISSTMVQVEQLLKMVKITNMIL